LVCHKDTFGNDLDVVNDKNNIEQSAIKQYTQARYPYTFKKKKNA